jgi:hypothetical protein
MYHSIPRIDRGHDRDDRPPDDPIHNFPAYYPDRRKTKQCNQFVSRDRSMMNIYAIPLVNSPCEERDFTH